MSHFCFIFLSCCGKCFYLHFVFLVGPIHHLTSLFCCHGTNCSFNVPATATSAPAAALPATAPPAPTAAPPLRLRLRLPRLLLLCGSSTSSCRGSSCCGFSTFSCRGSSYCGSTYYGYTCSGCGCPCLGCGSTCYDAPCSGCGSSCRRLLLLLCFTRGVMFPTVYVGVGRPTYICYGYVLCVSMGSYGYLVLKLHPFL